MPTKQSSQASIQRRYPNPNFYDLGTILVSPYWTELVQLRNCMLGIPVNRTFISPLRDGGVTAAQHVGIDTRYKHRIRSENHLIDSGPWRTSP